MPRKCFGPGSWPTLTTRVTNCHETPPAGRRPQTTRPSTVSLSVSHAGRQTDRLIDTWKGVAGWPEMSRRVGGAESRCQAQSVQSPVGHAPVGLAGWGPVRSSIFVEVNRRWSIFENLPMFPGAGASRRRAIVPQMLGTGVDPWRALCPFRCLGPGNGSCC